MGYNLLINGVYRGYNPLILTFYSPFTNVSYITGPKKSWIYDLSTFFDYVTRRASITKLEFSQPLMPLMAS